LTLSFPFISLMAFTPSKFVVQLIWFGIHFLDDSD
jgi:hypothetical protein